MSVYSSREFRETPLGLIREVQSNGLLVIRLPALKIMDCAGTPSFSNRQDALPHLPGLVVSSGKASAELEEHR